MTISQDKVVLIHFTLKDDQGNTLDSSEGRDPLGYLQGHKNLIPALEAALEGKSAGDKVNETFTPEEAYGKRNPEMVQKVPISNFDDASHVQVGASFHVQTPEGTAMAIVIEIEGEEVTLDMNHPLADMTLNFDVDVVEVREATAEELDHGHVHGVGGHQH